MEIIDGIPVWGKHEDNTIGQIKTVSWVGNVASSALMADGHYGYSMPIGGVVAYRDMISPSGVGFDISCGNAAVRTKVRYNDLKPNLSKIMDEIARKINFGVGGKNNDRDAQEHPLFDDPLWQDVRPEIQRLKDSARQQLGTVGGGNHYVDLFHEEESGYVWVANHFGSRGLGHKTATGFLNLAKGNRFTDKLAESETPTLLDTGSTLGQDYLKGMELAGKFAYAGRDNVIKKVLKLLGTKADFSVNCHHNYAWNEVHDGESVWVVRKGATPLFPGDVAFIGGSMCDVSVIVEGLEGSHTGPSLCSAPHGAGRVMGRRAAKGKVHRKTGEVIKAGRVTPQMMKEAVRDYGIELRGGDLDESPFVYRKLDTVLSEYDNLRILHTLRPIGVAMAGANVRDPYSG